MAISWPTRRKERSQIVMASSRLGACYTVLQVVTLLQLFFFCQGAASIDCFKCVSVDYNNPACDDPFHNNYTLDLLEAPCMGGRKNRNGVFPATACIKMAGKYEDGSHITIRGCALDSGTLTTDTEIIRMSHCGGFYYEGRYVRGCVQSCDDSDACNSSSRSAPRPLVELLGLLVCAYAGKLLLSDPGFTGR